MISTLENRFIFKRFDKSLEEVYKAEGFTNIIPQGYYAKPKDVNSWCICEMRCPICNDIVALAKRIHTVDENGIIMPSLEHRHTNYFTGTVCTFHEWIKLENWKE